MMLMPPNTILEMQTFMHDELHGNRHLLELNEQVDLVREPRLRRIARALLRCAPREITAYRARDRVDSTAV